MKTEMALSTSGQNFLTENRQIVVKTTKNKLMILSQITSTKRVKAEKYLQKFLTKEGKHCFVLNS